MPKPQSLPFISTADQKAWRLSVLDTFFSANILPVQSE